MALTRKFLAALGIESEKVDQIIEAHSETVSGLKSEIETIKGERDAAQKDADKLPDVRKELADLKKQVEDDQKANAGKDYDALKKEYDEYKAAVKEKEARAAKEAALKGILTDLKISDRGAALAVKYQDFAKIELDKDGNIKGADELRKSLKEDWGDYIVTTDKQGAPTQNPPGGAGGTGRSIEEIMAIENDEERQIAIAQNHELFGF